MPPQKIVVRRWRQPTECHNEGQEENVTFGVEKEYLNVNANGGIYTLLHLQFRQQQVFDYNILIFAQLIPQNMEILIRTPRSRISICWMRMKSSP